MRKDRFDKRTLDAAGQRLIAGDPRPLAEVERVVNDPLLFSRVKTRIAAESASMSTIWLDDRLSGLIRSHALASVTVAAVAIVALGFVASRVTVRTEVVTAPATAEPETIVPTATTVSGGVAALDSGEARPRKNVFHIERAAYRRPAPRQGKRKRAPEALNEGDFYAVSYTGDPAEADGGGRIVRVEMPRSSLFALGINLPLENDEGPVKADLLIGRDGSTRAIRVVK